MRKHTEVTVVQSKADIAERADAIKHIHKLSDEFIPIILHRNDLKCAIATSQVCQSTKEYKQRRIFRKSRTLTLPVYERLTLVHLLSTPDIWLVMDGRFASGDRDHPFQIVPIEGLHITALKELVKKLQDYVDCPFS